MVGTPGPGFQYGDADEFCDGEEEGGEVEAVRRGLGLKRVEREEKRISRKVGDWM